MTVPAEASTVGAESGETVRFSRLRKTIGRRLRESVTTKPQVTLHTTAPADVLEASRRAGQAACAPASLNGLIGVAAARALLAHPALNGFAAEDHVTLFDEVHLGVAVDAPAGLTVPVIRAAHAMSPAELTTAIGVAAEKARDGRLEPSDVLDATFTITNLGSYGVEQFTPIVNPPQIAVLGIGSLRHVPALGADGWNEAAIVHLSLTFDHAAVDGAPAARFLAALVELLQAPLDALCSEVTTSKENR